MNNDYMAIVKPTNYTKPVKIMFEAKDSSSALDEMYKRVNAATTSDIEEYELYQVLGDGRLMSVAFKPLTIVMPKDEAQNEPTHYTEKAYQSYRDVA